MSVTDQDVRVPASVPPTGAGPSDGKRAALGVALSLLSAVMLFVMWDSHGNIWPLAFVGFVPMFIASYRLMPRRLCTIPVGIAAMGYWFAFGLDVGGVLPSLVVVAIALSLGIFWAVVTIWDRAFAERTNYKWFIVQFALLWVGLELFLQYNLITGSNYWLAYRLAAIPQFDQPVSIFSTPALTFVIIMINAAIALLIMKWMDGRWPQLSQTHIPRQVVKWSSIITGGIVVIWILLSLVIYAQVNAQMGNTVRVAAVQSGIQYTTSSGQLGEGGEQGTPADIERNAKLQQQLTEMTMEAARRGAQLAVWPEEELDYDVRVGNQGAWVGELAKAANITIVSGFMPDSPNLTSPNLAAVWYPDGHMSSDVYAKVHPVLVEGEAFEPGRHTSVYPTSFGELGVIICFDHDFPDSTVRATVASGANIMAVPAIDPYTITHLRWQSLVFRAIENRVPMVKTDVGFDSAIVNANGQVVDRVAFDTPAGGTALLVADVNLGPRNSPFIQYGSYPFMLVVALGIVARYVRHNYLWRRARTQYQII